MNKLVPMLIALLPRIRIKWVRFTVLFILGGLESGLKTLAPSIHVDPAAFDNVSELVIILMTMLKPWFEVEKVLIPKSEGAPVAAPLEPAE